MKNLMMYFLIGVVLTLTSCGSSSGRRAERDVGTDNQSIENLVVIKTSGGVVTDVYKVNSIRYGTNGLVFIDNVRISGADLKVIEVNNVNKYEYNYVEYHMESDTVPYLTLLKVHQSRLKS